MSGAAYKERMEARQADFKRGIDGDEARRRRDDGLVSIRKNKREDQLAKRRQQCDSPVAPTITSAGGKKSVPDMPTMLAKLHGSTFEEVLEATTHFRKLLSLEKSPPIQSVIDAGIVPKLVQLCTAVDYPKLQYEAAWALTNIASGTSAQTKAVIDAGAVPVFIKLLMSPDENVREQCIWAIGNIAGDSPDNRDMVLRSGALPALVENLQHTKKLTTTRNISWTLSNLTRGKPQPEFALVACVLPSLAKLLSSHDEETLVDACWAISYLSDGGKEKIDAILRCNLIVRMVELMNHTNVSIQTPALRTIGNIATGDDAQTQAVIDSGALTQLVVMMRSTRKGIRKEAAWTVSNVAAGSSSQIEAVRKAGCLPEVIRLLQEGEHEVKKECAWVLSNYCSGGTREQIRFLCSKKAIKPLCDMLAGSEVKTLLVVLEALRSILKAGVPEGNESATNEHALMVEDADGIDKIEALQTHANTKVYEKAVDLIETYFSGEEEEENNLGLAPGKQQGAFQFDSAQCAPAFGAQPFQFGNSAQPANMGGGGGFSFGSPAPMTGILQPSTFAFNAQQGQFNF